MQNQKNILIIGAGRLGKGFIGEAFEKAKWRVSFLDKNPQVINNLKKGSYKVKISTPKEIKNRTVRNYQQFLTGADHPELSAFLTADIVMIPVYPEDLEGVFTYIMPDLVTQQKQNPNKKLDFVLLTNKIYLAKKVNKFLDDKIEPNLRSWLRNHIFVRDAIVRRSTDAKSNASLEIYSMAVASLLIETPLHISLSDVDWMEPIENVPKLKKVKVYTLNGPHAATAFFGKYKHYQTIPEAQSDIDIQFLIKKVKVEIYQACMKEFAISQDEIDQLVKMPHLKGEVPDAISRVAYDPLRKLSNNDRLCGPIKLCEKYGLKHEGLDKAVALGLKYYDKDDPKSVEMQKLIENKGILPAIKEITGLDDNCAQSILTQYEKL